jgi:hypothetical protein
MVWERNKKSVVGSLVVGFVVASSCERRSSFEDTM